jgi:hypothetical protein
MEPKAAFNKGSIIRVWSRYSVVLSDVSRRQLYLVNRSWLASCGLGSIASRQIKASCSRQFPATCDRSFVCFSALAQYLRRSGDRSAHTARDLPFWLGTTEKKSTSIRSVPPRCNCRRDRPSRGQLLNLPAGIFGCLHPTVRLSHRR